MKHSVASNVRLIDNGLVPRRAWRPVVAPRKCRINNATLANVGRVIALIKGRIVTRFELITE